jgi:hypothetical protein
MADTDLVVSIASAAGPQDRTEVQLSDGMDDGDTRDPS